MTPEEAGLTVALKCDHNPAKGICVWCLQEAIKVAVAEERERMPVELIAELMAGLSVPGSLRALGAAHEPWVKLREHWKLFGYQSTEEIAAAIRSQGAGR